MEKIPQIIAELGTSHGGDPKKAADLVAAAAETGADCIKCQIVYADEILHPETGMVRLPGGDIPLYQVFKILEQKPEFYARIKEEAEKRGLLFLASPFGPKSAAELKKLSPKAVKIASPELNYCSLTAEIASWGIKTYISTGISLLGDIEAALEPFCEARNAPELEGERPGPEQPSPVLLHCVTAYPAPAEDYNLRLLPLLGGIFGCETGVSDHSLDPVLVPVLAAAMGAAAIEKHFCLSRDDPGLDDKIALPPEDFAAMVKAVRRASLMEKSAILSEIGDMYGPECVEKVLGDGVKRLASSEKANYERTRRSIHAMRAIEAGEIINGAMIGILRTEKVLRPGLAPSWEEKIIGKRAKTAIPAGQGIRLEDIL
jgi:sialic acid synthase SpsE